MSYDLMVFDHAVAPRDPNEFRQWYFDQTEWAEDHGYSDPAVTTDGLRRWYEEIRETYPNMNEPNAVDMDRLELAADYSIGCHVIYGAFSWSQAEEVYPLFRELAVKHEVGFYDVSGDEGDGEIHFPGDTLRPPSSGAWRSISKQFQGSET